MKIASIRTESGDRLSLALGDTLFDISTAASHFGIDGLSELMTDLISDVIERPWRQAALTRLAEAFYQLDSAESDQLKISDNFTWLPPLRRPGKILCVAMNNKASDERKISAPSHPAFFLKPSSCLVGHQQPIELREYCGSVHPEPELALVIGKRVRDVSAKDAWDAIYD
ncbi:MAG: 2,4-diketo-3-deoxy-L-fuconate hydrolase [Parasphingorhabdus sp.]|jgi:2,4-diketo-3-deoxy-L-fuconate hydrolase